MGTNGLYMYALIEISGRPKVFNQKLDDGRISILNQEFASDLPRLRVVVRDLCDEQAPRFSAPKFHICGIPGSGGEVLDFMISLSPLAFKPVSLCR